MFPHFQPEKNFNKKGKVTLSMQVTKVHLLSKWDEQLISHYDLKFPDLVWYVLEQYMLN